MLNLGGGSSAGSLLVLNSDPHNLLATSSMSALAQAQCYYTTHACRLAPYDSLRGEPYFVVDARLAKNIKLGEGRNLQLIFQAFNLFNHANYGNNFDPVVDDVGTTFRNPSFSLTPRALRCRGRSPEGSGPASLSKRNPDLHRLPGSRVLGFPWGAGPLPDSPLSGKYQEVRKG